MSVKVNRHRMSFEHLQFVVRLLNDAFAIVCAWFLSYYLRFFVIPGGKIATDTFSFFAAMSVLVLVSGLVFIYTFRLYEPSDTATRSKEIVNVFKSTVASFLFIVFVYYFFLSSKVSRVHLGLYGIMEFLFLVLGRVCANRFFARRIKKGKFCQSVLLVGGGDRLVHFYNSITGRFGVKRYKIVGHYMGGSEKVRRVKQIEAPSLLKAVEETKADVVFIAFPDDSVELENRVVIEALELYSQQVFVLPRIPKTYTGSELSEIRKQPVIRINYSEMSAGNKFAKRVFDLVACSLGVIVLSPLYLIIAILVKLSSPGPVFFSQKRVTEDGKVFNMYKFRSMRTDMPEGNAHWTKANDPRVTKIGAFLRKTSLDEIPQFFNVIQGSMSLIGPRPERPELEANFKKTIPGYYMRHRMKAGITGWAQVNGLRGNTSLEKRIDYDLYYIRNWSFWFDIKIFFLTFFKGFVNKNAY